LLLRLLSIISFREVGLEPPENYNEAAAEAEFNAEPRATGDYGFNPQTADELSKKAAEMLASLSPSQRVAYDAIMASLDVNAPPGTPNKFWLEGEGGCGTFCLAFHLKLI